MAVFNTRRAVLSIAWGGLLAFDVTVFVLTLYKAMKVGYNTLLIQTLVRDGEHIRVTYINQRMTDSILRIPLLRVRFAHLIIIWPGLEC